MIEIDRFIDSQLEAWPQARANYEALQKIETKDVAMPATGEHGAPFVMKVQFNPARIVSTGAKMDANTLKERPCFLCEKNRPALQRGIEWGDYVILVNPFPIFPRHLTIPLRAHQPQSIMGRAADMARLAQMLPEFAVFYNGQKCGASAPDHMHFQAGTKTYLPLIDQIGDVKYVTDGIGYPTNESLLPGIIVIDAATAEQAQERFDRVIGLLPQDPEVGEPMMNVLCWENGDDIRMAIIPRKRHRPDFYGDGPGQMILSPASVDLGGVMITPRREDFDRLDAATIAATMAQLCFNSEEIKEICKNLK